MRFEEKGSDEPRRKSSNGTGRSSACCFYRRYVVLVASRQVEGALVSITSAWSASEKLPQERSAAASSQLPNDEDLNYNSAQFTCEPLDRQQP